MMKPEDDGSPVAKWDPDATKSVIAWVRPILKAWFRAEVRGLDRLPAGGALVVSNHSGGLYAVDVPVFASEFYETFGYERPVYTLSNDIMFNTLTAEAFTRIGFIRASRENAAKALRAGGAVVVFPGGDYDAYRPTAVANTINFAGRKGYVRTAIETGAPIVPMVSIGAQENQIFLTRGDWIAKLLGIKQKLGTNVLPITFGIPFGFNFVLPLNFPLPTKIVTQVLEPIHVSEMFGADPDIDDVDAHVRGVMQAALDRLARERRFPLLG